MQAADNLAEFRAKKEEADHIADLSKMQVCSLLSRYRLDIRTNLGEFNVEDEGAVGLDTLGALLAVTEF